MKTSEVEEYLRSRHLGLEGVSTDFGRREDAAFVRLTNFGEPQRWAVVASPGTRWVAVELPGGFSLSHFDEDLGDDETRAILDNLLEVAVAYMRSGAAPTSVGRLKLPALVVSTPNGDRVLRRSLVADVKGLVRRERGHK